MNLFQIFIVPFKIQNSKFKIIFFFVTSSILSESYKEHRLDDINYLYQGRKTIKNEGRIETSIPTKINIDANSKPEQSENGFAVSSYFTPKFYSQKGGKEEDLARRYAMQVNYSPELAGFLKKDNSKYLLLFSPILSYREDYHLKRNVNRPLDFEYLLAWKWEKNAFSFNLEGGRGYQRLDAYGLFFNGIANYAETNFYWKPKGIKLSLIGLSYNYKQNDFTLRANYTNDKLAGGSIIFESVPFVKHLQFFSYWVLEPIQLAERNFLQADKPFKPYGKFHYRGFELKTENFLKRISLELGIFSVKGYREYAEYSYQTLNHVNKTNGFLSYLTLNFDFNGIDFRVGGLYATKDKSTSFQRAHNGYSPLLSDVRIFGGKSSFLLMETVEQRNGTLFREFDSTKENSYDTKGMELVNFTISYFVNRNFQITGILNHTSSNLGVGNEAILSLFYQQKSLFNQSSFILASFCLARVNPVTQEKVFYDEFRVDPTIKEFARFFVSGGMYF